VFEDILYRWSGFAVCLQTYCIDGQVLLYVCRHEYRWPDFAKCLQTYCNDVQVLLYVCRRTVIMVRFCCIVCRRTV